MLRELGESATAIGKSLGLSQARVDLILFQVTGKPAKNKRFKRKTNNIKPNTYYLRCDPIVFIVNN